MSETFHRLGPGVYQCVKCGAECAGAFAKQDIKSHVRNHADGVCDALPARFAAYAPPSNAVGDGYIRPDRHGRWNAGRTPEDRRAIKMSRAFHALDMRAQAEDAFFERVMTERHSRSPKQRAAYHFNVTRDFQACWKCALEEAFNARQRERMDAAMEKVLDMRAGALDIAALANLEAKAIANPGEFINLSVGDVNINVN